MEAVGDTTIKINPLKAIGKTIIAIWIGFIAFGESAGRARAAAELSRQGFHAEAKRLMLDKR
jgi:hypothetical protein